MEPVAAAIIAALTTGASSGATEVAKKAISDAYSGMKAIINKKFGGNSDVTEAIEKLQAKPDSSGRQQILAEELRATNASSDAELLEAARSLLEFIKTLPQGDQHIQNAVGTGIAQADQGSRASVSFATPSISKERD
jgi:hypothetical protein